MDAHLRRSHPSVWGRVLRGILHKRGVDDLVFESVRLDVFDDVSFSVCNDICLGISGEVRQRVSPGIPRHVEIGG